MSETKPKATRLAVVAIVVEDRERVAELNDLLHRYGNWIIGRMGIPYRERKISIICLAIDAPNDRINALTGALGRIKGLRAKATYSAV